MLLPCASVTEVARPALAPSPKATPTTRMLQISPSSRFFKPEKNFFIFCVRICRFLSLIYIGNAEFGGNTMEKNDAAEQFYHTYRSLIFRTAARLCRTQEDLDDLIQVPCCAFSKILRIIRTEHLTRHPHSSFSPSAVKILIRFGGCTPKNGPIGRTRPSRSQRP